MDRAPRRRREPKQVNGRGPFVRQHRWLGPPLCRGGGLLVAAAAAAAALGRECESQTLSGKVLLLFGYSKGRFGVGASRLGDLYNRKGKWTTGKLNFPFCEACLEEYNFISNTACLCGQFTDIHLCKRQTECQIASRLPKSQLKHLSLCKCHFDSSKEIHKSATSGILRAENQRVPYLAKSNDSTGRLMEALCLELRSANFEMNNKKLCFKVSNLKASISASLAQNDGYTVKAFHRIPQSLRKGLVLLPTLYGISTIERPVFSRQHETQHFNSKDCLPLKSNKVHNYFQFQLESDTIKLSKNFSVTPYRILAQEETGFNPVWKASKSYLESAVTDQQLFLPSSKTIAKENTLQLHIIPFYLLQPFTTIDQELYKKKRNQLNNLEKKHRWQDQTMNTKEEYEHRKDKESYLCAVCLDIYFNPYKCYPCHHIFCEPCLRMLAKDNPTSTPCPLCRTAITHVFFQSELNNSTETFFPMEYSKLKENFQKSNLANWPLPSCKKVFRVIDGFQSTDSFTRRHFPHAAHRMDYMDFEDDSRGWRFDMDMVIIYIYAINWVLGFIVFCFLCYFFFPF
ncbi:E3 ubiquitin-protein ligase RNF180 [Protobothrops mucrosquamatus]|uniref:E3 ubiquitin-protein ligase RNF180 n=1 Tax=Protobothrops mucrosquamatus TaxID=103944 RepID=UPI000775EBA8|nr:E3 ubiquitin-protein ligase RNF180 [Protobothrops mucrosquamatus]